MALDHAKYYFLRVFEIRYLENTMNIILIKI